MLAILPSRRFVIESPLPPAELLDRISGSVERSRWAVFRTVHAPFRGEVDGSNFKLRRITWYGNALLPVIVGRVEARGDGGSQLIGVMRLAYRTAVFMMFWLSKGAIIALQQPQWRLSARKSAGFRAHSGSRPAPGSVKL